MDLLRALHPPVLLHFLSGLPKSITLLVEVSTRAPRVALLRYAGLGAPQHAQFAAVRPDSEVKNRMVFVFLTCCTHQYHSAVEHATLV